METAVASKKVVIKGGYFIFVAYLLFTFGFYAIYNVSSLNVYYVSYYAHSNPNSGISMRSVYFTTSIIGFANAIAISISGLLEQKTGIRITLIIATCIGLLSAILLYIFQNVPALLKDFV